MTSRARSRQPGWVVGRILLSGWIVLTSIALITGANGRPYFVVVGFFSITVVAALAARLAVRLTRGTVVPRVSSPGQDGPLVTIPPTTVESPLDRLHRHDPTIANQVQVALDLLTGPLVAVLGRADTSRTRAAITLALNEYGAVDEAVERTAAAHRALSTTLSSADIDTVQDADAQHLVQHEADLRRRRAEMADRLHRAATGLQSAWEPLRDQQILRLRRGQLSRARDTAEEVAAQGIPDADASAGLADAVEEIQGSLGGIREIDGINDRILGDAAVLGAPAPPSATVDGGPR